MQINKSQETLQFMGSQNDIKFDFYYEGGKVTAMIYDET
jgi:hypothetical protein